MSDRDRRAEQIRTVLRRAGFDDLDEGHLYGFAVEGGDDETARAYSWSR